MGILYDRGGIGNSYFLHKDRSEGAWPLAPFIVKST